MLKKNLLSIAIIMSGLFLTGSAFGQWNPDIDKISVKKTSTKTPAVKSPKSVSTSTKQTVKKPQTGSLIDTSTGEVVWAKANPKRQIAPQSTNSLNQTTGKTSVKYKKKPQQAGSDEELSALIAW